MRDVILVSPAAERSWRTVSQGDEFHGQALSVRLTKKRNPVAFEHARNVINALARLDHDQRCKLLYFDESCFSPNPLVQYG